MTKQEKIYRRNHLPITF